MNHPFATVPLTTPIIVNPLWHSFDPSEEDRELWILEQETFSEMERIENKHQDLIPIGKSGNEVKQMNYVDDEEEEDEEEDDNDDDDSDSHDDEEDDEEIDMELDGNDSPTF